MKSISFIKQVPASSIVTAERSYSKSIPKKRLEWEVLADVRFELARRAAPGHARRVEPAKARVAAERLYDWLEYPLSAAGANKCDSSDAIQVHFFHIF